MEATGLSRTIDGAPLFDSVRLTIAAAEILFIVGPSGSGKSLLLRLFARLDPLPLGATLTLRRADGRLLTQDASPMEWRTNVLYLSQSRVDFPGSPLDTLSSVLSFKQQKSRLDISLDSAIAEMKELGSAVGLDDTLLAKAWSELSGGESQRAWIVTALATKPEILLLDEPTSALDHESAGLVEGAINYSGVTTIWISHDGAQPSRVGGRVLTFPLVPDATLNERSVEIVRKLPSKGTSGSIPRASLAILPYIVFCLTALLPTASAAAVLATHPALSSMLQQIRDLLSDGGGELAGPVKISWMSVTVAFLLMICLSVVSSLLDLQMSDVVIISAIRCILQLTLLGYILLPIFRLNNPFFVVMYMSFMVLAASLEAVGRPNYSYKGIFGHAMIAIGFAGGLTGAFGLVALFKVGLEAQYAIPILGMLLGNALTGISVALNATVTELAENKNVIERLLAFGASQAEATAQLRRRSAQLGLAPSLNQVSVAGLVAIPGMMTGQMLGGTGPAQAARYQILLLFMISACTAIGVLLIIELVITAIIDSSCCLRSEVIRPPGKSMSSITADLFQSTAGIIKRIVTRRSSGLPDERRRLL